MAQLVVRAIQNHISLESCIVGYEAAEACGVAVQRAYRSVGDLIGTRPENIAFTSSATASYMQALSSIRFERGDVILTTRNDFVSNQIQLLSLQARMGVRVMRAPDQAEGGVDVQAMRDLIHRCQPKLVCVTHVPTNSGLVQDVGAVGAVCRDYGVLYLVDACQSVGQMPVDVRELQCEFLSATARKRRGIVSIAIDGADPADLVAALRDRRINTYAHKRAHAVIDCDDKGVKASLRLSPHYYNTEEEIDHTVSVIQELLQGVPFRQMAAGSNYGSTG